MPRFSDAAALAAVHELENTAHAIRTAVGALEATIPATVEGWQGRFRHSFDVETARHDLVARDVARNLDLTAAAVRARQFEARARISQAGQDWQDT